LKTSDHKLQLLALGKLSEGGVELKIEGNNSKQTQNIKLNAEHQLIELNKSDTVLKITFVTADGNYMETLYLQ
jgi:hypothetical protein